MNRNNVIIPRLNQNNFRGEVMDWAVLLRNVEKK